MKNLWKKILCFVFPIMMVAMIATGLIATYKMRNIQEDEEKTSIGNAQSPIYYASAEDTGASTASSSEKGGAIYLGENSVYTMKNGTISGHSNTYGGAIYVSNGAVLTMTGGTISNNTATYGGAIYIENGGRCDITGGTITGNKADNAPAIYVEEGGQLNISGTAIIENNTVPTVKLSITFSLYESDYFCGDNHIQGSSIYGVNGFSYIDDGESLTYGTYNYRDGNGNKSVTNFYTDSPYSSAIDPFSAEDSVIINIPKGLSWYEVIELCNITFQIPLYSNYITDSSGKKLYSEGLLDIYGWLSCPTRLWNLDSDNPIFTEDTDITFNSWIGYGCFDIETEMLCYDEKNKRYYKKKLKDLTYKDKLVVWNFDKGCFDVSEPLFITKTKTAKRYTKVTFSDGSVLKVVGNDDGRRHRILNIETGKFEYVGTATPVGTTTFNAKGEKVKVTKLEFISEPIEYAKVISNYHINCFANNIIVSSRMVNIYEIKDMKYVKDDRPLRKKEDYPDIDQIYFDGLRIAEQPEKINRDENDMHYDSFTQFVEKWIKDSKPRE